jgi:hypothetical protein
MIDTGIVRREGRPGDSAKCVSGRMSFDRGVSAQRAAVARPIRLCRTLLAAMVARSP